jgi:hypothetical protein
MVRHGIVTLPPSTVATVAGMSLVTRWRWGVLGAAALLGGTALASGRRPTPAVVVEVEGLRDQDVMRAGQLGLRIPQLRRLLAEGAHARVQGVAGVKAPGLVTLLTGVAPERHGVQRESPLDPLGPGRPWGIGDVRVATLGQAAQRAGLRSAAVGWPLAGADVEAEADTDPARAERCAALLASEAPPGLVLCRFTSLDEAQRASGPGSFAALAALERTDALLGQVREAAARDGRSLIVVSAHGCARTRRALDLDEVLRRAGLLQRDPGGRLRGWRALAWGEGGSALVVLRDPGDASGRRLVRAVLDDLVCQGLLARFFEHREAQPGSPAPVFTAFLAPDTRLARLGPGEVSGVGGGGASGHDPRLPEMAGSLFLLGPGVRPGQQLGPVDLRDVAPTVAGLLGLRLPDAEGRDLIGRVALASR